MYTVGDRTMNETTDIRETVNVCYETLHKKTTTPEIPITGVINSNTPEWLYEEISNAIDLSYETWVDECNPTEEEKDCYESQDDTYLIGFKLNSDNEYEPDPDAEFSVIVSEIYAQVVRSKFVSKCAMCSLCFPHQGDLDTAGDQVTYTLPEDVFGDAKHLPITALEV